MRKSHVVTAVLLSLVAVSAVALAATTISDVTAKAVANPKGDGPDGKGNTQDDTLQFWFQLIGMDSYRRLDIATATMSPQQRAKGIRGKVSGPIGAWLPNKEATEGWIYHSDWDGRGEGVWGDTKANCIMMHPYNEKTDGGCVAFTVKIPADGKYTITGKVTDVQVASGHYTLTGITWLVDVMQAKDGNSLDKPIKHLGKGKMGDKVGPPSMDIKIENVELKAGQLIRLAIDPNKWWGADMTKVENFKITKVD